MPRSQKTVKKKPTLAPWDSSGVVDLHFHGALGVDLATASSRQCTDLSREMGRAGIAAFCPTLLSLEPRPLEESVRRLGAWIMRTHPQDSALPLGLHLEGPFLSKRARGAHPESAIRPFDFEELERLRLASRDQIRILTLAPEEVPSEARAGLGRWASDHRIHLSMGHSRATRTQACAALAQGFAGVTHAWNAMSFHHREPGLLGAALGHRGVAVEVIPDGVHVDPVLVQWVVQLHQEAGPVCFVSDCVPAAMTPPGSGPYAFGPELKVALRDGASRLADGTLAGGNCWLPQAFGTWINSTGPQDDLRRSFERSWRFVFHDPVRVLGLQGKPLARRTRIRWTLDPKIGLQPLLP